MIQRLALYASLFTLLVVLSHYVDCRSEIRADFVLQVELVRLKEASDYVVRAGLGKMRRHVKPKSR